MKLVALVEGCVMRFEAFLVLIPLCIPNILLLPRRAVKSYWMWGMWSLHGCACVYESLFSSLFSSFSFPWHTSSWSSWGLKPFLQVLFPAEVAAPWRSTGSLVSTEPLCFFGDLAVPDMAWVLGGREVRAVREGRQPAASPSVPPAGLRWWGAAWWQLVLPVPCWGVLVGPRGPALLQGVPAGCVPFGTPVINGVRHMAGGTAGLHPPPLPGARRSHRTQCCSMCRLKYKTNLFYLIFLK